MDQTRSGGLKRYGLALACLALAGLLPGASAGRDATLKPEAIVARYDAGLASFNLGEFKVVMRFNGSAYDMRAHGKFSVLAGLAFKATGESTSKGTLNAGTPRPVQYTSKYDGGKKREQRRIEFTNGAVSGVTIVPRKNKRNPRHIPVSSKQLQGVLDPLTAAFLSVQSSAPAGDTRVCNRTVPVFEGKQRFNIKLSPKGTAQLGNRAPKGLSRRAAVCRVRYEPVAGHRPDHPGVQYMTKNEDIEAWLVPVPGTKFVVPYKILVPTAWGTGTVTLKGLTVKHDPQRRAAAP